MDNKEDFFKNYRGRYSQYWIERWGLSGLESYVESEEPRPQD